MVKSQVEEYHRIEKLVIEGDLYRLDSPFNGNFFAFEITAKDKSESVITCFRNLEDSNMPNKFFYPKGLDPEAEYEVCELAASGISLQVYHLSS
jgi:alpha-galactosidase